MELNVQIVEMLYWPNIHGKGTMKTSSIEIPHLETVFCYGRLIQFNADKGNRKHYF